MRRALVLLLATVSVAGCLQHNTSEATNSTSPNETADVTSHLVAGPITIAPSNDPNRTTIYEDDPAAIVRYDISDPADAPRETSFVTVSLNGAIVSSDQLTLDPGATRHFERTVNDLRVNRTIHVEVRAGRSTSRADASVTDWPRAGSDALAIGPLSIRADYGLLQQDGKVVVNLTLALGNDKLYGLKAQMLCADASGAIQGTWTVLVPTPDPNNSTGVDVTLADCSANATRYGIQFDAFDTKSQPVTGRLLLVAHGWRP